MHFSPQCSSSSTRFFSARHTSAHVEPSPTGTRKLICSRFVAQLHLRFSLYPAERFPDILQAILSHRDSKAASPTVFAIFASSAASITGKGDIAVLLPTLGLRAT